MKNLFEFIKNKHSDINEPTDNLKILEYFENNYLFGKCPIDFWNVCGEQHRTNNISESFNRELRHYFNDKNYFKGGKSPNGKYFEPLLYKYIKFEVIQHKYKVTKEKNDNLKCKNEMISFVKKNINLFKDEELLLLLCSVLEMSKHKMTKEGKTEKVIIDDEFFETNNDSQIDNINGEDGIGNDVSEILENQEKNLENQEKKIVEIEMDEPVIYKDVMEKLKPMIEEVNLESFSDCLKNTIRNEKQEITLRPREKKTRKKRTYRKTKYDLHNICYNTFDERFKNIFIEQMNKIPENENFINDMTTTDLAGLEG